MDHKNSSCKKLYCRAHPRCCPQIYCRDMPCTTSRLQIIGQPVPHSDEPMTSSNLAFRYTRPTEIIQEDINVNNLTLSDTSLQCAPLHLRQLFHLYNIDILSTAHVMFLLVYLIALECGFITKQHFLKFCRVLIPTPTFFTYHSKNVLFLSRKKPIYQFDRPYETYFSIELRVLNRNLKDSSLYSQLTALVSGDYFIVTLTPDTSYLRGFSACLPISRYILSKLSAREAITQYFRKLDQLTMKLRDEIFIPVRNEQLGFLGANIYPSINGLPLEICELYYEYLNDDDLMNMFRVSAKFSLQIEITQSKLNGDHKQQTELRGSKSEDDNSKTLV